MNRLVSLTCAPHHMGGSIRTDGGHFFLAQTDSGRLTWPIPTEITGGGDLQLQALIPGYADYNGRCVLPPGSTELAWDKDGVLVTEPLELAPLAPTLEPLHVEGRTLLNASGQAVRYAGATHFLHFQRYLEWKLGRGAEPCDYAGANAYRATALMTYIPGLAGLPPLRPENYQNYWSEAPGYVDYLLSKGRYPHICVRCDIQMSGQTPAQLRAIDAQWAEIMGGRGLLSKGNEAFKNGWDPSEARHPGHGVVWCSGTNRADEPPLYFPDDNLIEWEGRRDWPKVTSSSEDMWYVAKNSGRGLLHVETMGFDEVYLHEKRSTDPELARQIGATCAALNGDEATKGGYVNGAAVHLQDGIFSQPLRPIQEQCRAAFFLGLKGA